MRLPGRPTMSLAPIAVPGVVATDAGGEGLIRSEWMQCELRADLALGRQALDELTAFVRHRGLGAEECRAIELATAEGINNAIEHGCIDRPRSTIRIVWGWVGEVIEVRVLDPGSFCPDRQRQTLPNDPLKESGRGLYLMASLVDAVEHRLVEQGHELILRKKVGLPKAPSRTLEQLQQAVETMAEDLHVTYEDFSALLRLSEELATARSFETFLAVACRRLRELLQGEITCCFRLLDVKDGLEMIYGESKRPVPLRLEPSRTCVEMEVATHKAEQRVDDCMRLAEDDPLHAAQGCAFVDPVLFQDKLLGVFTVVRPDSRRPFTETQSNFIRSVSDFLGIALTTLSLQGERSQRERASRELEIAATIQTSLLPKEFPENSNYCIFGQSRSALEVGGDYFDVLPVRNVGVLLVIADVMGKGVPAALLATIFRTAVRCRLDLATRPGLLLSAVNQQITEDLYHLDMFITAQVAYLCYETHRLFLANAGHCPLLRLSGKNPGTAQRHGIQGYPLGVGGSIRFKEEVIGLDPGDKLLFLTDGIFELENSGRQMLGMEQLVADVPRLWQDTPENFASALFDYLNIFSHGAPATDDRTVLMVQRS